MKKIVEHAMPSVNAAPVKKHTFLMLDALRGVAALSVVLLHYVGYMYDHSTEWPPSAFLAVDFFFLLSGFVVAHAYEERLRAGMTMKQFIIVRLIRLYPLYWLDTTIPILFGILQNITAGKELTWSLLPLSYFISLAFLPTPINWIVTPDAYGAFPHNVPAWSLSMEMGINLLFATLCVHLTTPRLKWIIAVAGLALLGSYFTYHEASLGWSWENYWQGLPRVAFSFSAGILLLRYFHKANPKPLTMIYGIGAAASLFAIFLAPHSNVFPAILACFVLFPLIVWIGGRVHIRAPFAKFCSWMGRLSYVLYITHKPLLPIFIWVLAKIHVDSYPHPRVAVVVFTAAAVVIAIVLDQIFDIPLRSYLNRKFVLRKMPLPKQKS